MALYSYYYFSFPSKLWLFPLHFYHLSPFVCIISPFFDIIHFSPGIYMDKTMDDKWMPILNNLTLLVGENDVLKSFESTNQNSIKANEWETVFLKLWIQVWTTGQCPIPPCIFTQQLSPSVHNNPRTSFFSNYFRF